METKANYVLIGLFTLAGILGALGLLLWLAKVEVDRQYAYYDILFADVSGLGAASDVRYNGLAVGQVVGLDLDEEDPSQVRVRIEVAADTPVNTETVAQLQAQGVTGVSYVALSGGSDASTPLPDDAVIPSERTALQSVFEGAPLVLERAVTLLENINDVFDDENKAAVASILDNLSTSSGRLDTVLSDFESLSADLGTAAREVAAFSQRLDQLADTADTTLTTATGALETANVTIADIGAFTTQELTPLAQDLRTTSQTATRVIDNVGTEAARISGRLDQLADQGSVTLDAATQTLRNANQTFDTANTALDGFNTFTSAQLVPLAEDLRTTSQTANRVIDEVGGEVQSISGRISDIADSGTVALETATQTFSDAQATLGAVNGAVANIDRFTNEQLTPLAQDARTTVQTANRVVADVGERSVALADRLDTLADDGTTALRTATTAFENSTDTLALIDTAMLDASETLASADKTFSMANQIIENDIGGIIVDLRGAATAFTNTVTQAAKNIDAISNEVLVASQSAASFTGTLDSVFSGNQRQLSEFLRLGLPEFLRFTEEARSLVVNLERLVNRIERDPARFLLGTQNSEFRR